MEQKCPILSITNLLMEFFNTGFILYFFLLVLSNTTLELDIGEVMSWVAPSTRTGSGLCRPLSYRRAHVVVFKLFLRWGEPGGLPALEGLEDSLPVQNPRPQES